MLRLYLMEIGLIILVLIIWNGCMKRKLKDLGIPSIKKHKKEFIAGIVFGMIAISFVFIVLVLMGSVKIVEYKWVFSWNQVVYLGFFILVGFAEEILTRGLIMSSLDFIENKFIIIMISAIFFSLMHIENQGIGWLSFLNIFLAGLFFSSLFIKTKNLYTGIGFHISWNYLQGCVFGFPVSGLAVESLIFIKNERMNLLNGGIFGPEGGVLVTIVFMICLFAATRRLVFSKV